MSLLGHSFLWTILLTHGRSWAFLARVDWTEPNHLTVDSQIHLSGPYRAPSETAPLADLHDALETMQTFDFNLCIGKWPAAIDWTAAVTNTHLTSSLACLGKASQHLLESANPWIFGENVINQYFSQIIAFYFGENIDDVRYQAYDDMLWVVLEWIEVIRLIRSRSIFDNPQDDTPLQPWHGVQFVNAFARRAHEFYKLARNGWDTALCDGGMIWNPRLEPYKNAITNELFISASIDMYLYHPGDNMSCTFALDNSLSSARNISYLYAAIEAYDWFKMVNLTNAQGLVVDGYHVTDWKDPDNIGTGKCDLRNEMVYTYNQGVLLSGLRGLWESTGNRTYLDDGHELVRNTISATGWILDNSTSSNGGEWSGLGRAGILEEICDASGRCSQDAQTFKGIYFHHLVHFCESLPSRPLFPGQTRVVIENAAPWHLEKCIEYSPWVAHNARAALNTRDANGKFGSWWGAHVEYLPDSPLPVGAVDYRNLHLDSGETRSPSPDYYHSHEDGESSRQISSDPMTKEHLQSRSDPNDRGRGRTVETQGGGLAVVRAWWEFSRL